MEYVIDEKNLQRQYLLAETLEPWTVNMLNNFNIQEGSKILDLGCGLGDTSFLLSRQYRDVKVVGMDKDPELIATASSRAYQNRNVEFLLGDVEDLPFESEYFDFVFLRYLLLHLKTPLTAVQEIKRVCKKGGIIMAIEPDFCYLDCFPTSDAYRKMANIFQNLFADAHVGRKLLSIFHDAGLSNSSSIIAVFPDMTEKKIKQLYTLTGEALRLPITKSGFMNDQEYAAWIRELKRIEEDPSYILIGSPSITIWATKDSHDH